MYQNKGLQLLTLQLHVTNLIDSSIVLLAFHFINSCDLLLTPKPLNRLPSSKKFLSSICLYTLFQYLLPFIKITSSNPT